MRVTKKQIAKQVSEELGIPRTLVLRVVNSFIGHIADAVAGGARVELRNFGIFTVRHLGKRIIMHPATKQNMSVPPRTAVKFKPGKRFRDL